MSKTPKVALVLAGGAKRGLGHVGVLEVLHPILSELQQHQNLMLVTCSAGSIAGGFYLDRLDPNYLKKMALEMADIGIYRLFGMPSMWRGMQGDGFFSMDKIHSFLETKIKARLFEELHAPLHILASNLHTGAPAILSSGELISAICASSAVPFLFQPVTIHGHDYVDGFVFAEMPVRYARNLGAEITIAVNIQEKVFPVPGEKIRNSGIRSMKMLNLGRLREDIKEADIIIDLELFEEGHFSTTRADVLRLYEKGKKAATAQLPSITKKLHNYLS